MHVVLEHQPFWSSSVGLLLLLIAVLALGVFAGTLVQKGGISAAVEKLFSDFTNLLAYLVVLLAFSGIFLLAFVVLRSGGAANAETAKYVFAAILPLLGTWVGTVLAHYFQKENLAAATQSITTLASKVGGAERLQSTPLRTVMLRPDRIDTLPDQLLDKPDEQIKLAQLVSHLREGIKRDRLPLFRNNQKIGPAARVLHRSVVEKFVTECTFESLPAAAGATGAAAEEDDGDGQPSPAATPPPASPTAAAKAPADLTLADLMADPELGRVVRGSFGLVKSDATLADAKKEMDKASNALGAVGNCYDVFVTDTGNPDEPVIGWITNDIINENARV